MLDRLNRILPLPYVHFMGFAPLDAWARLLCGNGAWRRIPLKYWPRVGVGLCTSAIGTVITLPERVVLGVLGMGAAAGRGEGVDSPARAPTGRGGVLVVLGYYRSGTTHLHYLLSCDPGLITPRWHQALAPQGWVVSWTLLRFLLVPFLSSKRPQDDVAYGPEYPAEDDFAVCNWTGACAMPGRMVLPREWAYYRRFHGLEGLSAGEMGRFRRAQRAFTWRIALLGRGKRVLLKTPSHTARVRELVSLFGAGNVKFVHISRDAGPVLKSNVAMHGRFAPFLLQDHVGEEEVRRRVVEEYDATERKFLAESAGLGAGTAARMRYEDLIADPVGEVRRVYAELGLEFTREFAVRLGTYLESVRDYRAASERRQDANSKDDRLEPPAAELAWMHAAFGHDRPAREKAGTGAGAGPENVRAVEKGEEERAPSARLRAAGHLPHGGGPLARSPLGEVPASAPILAAVTAAAWCLAVWLCVSYFAHNRMDWLLWPAGVIIGSTALQTARRGSVRLGLWAAALTLGVLVIGAYPATWLSDYAGRDPVPWNHVWDSTRKGIFAMNTAAWIALSVMSAYRFASRQHVRPPGM